MKRKRTSAPRLFAADALTVRPSAKARLKALASRPARPATPRERLAEEDEATIARLRRWGEDLARRFGLRYLTLEQERDGVFGHYGICYEDGLIRIRLRHAKTGRLLKESSLVDTLCHELAHLRHFDHSLRFRRLYLRILGTARRLGYYRPGPEQGRDKPRQLSLFDPGMCGTIGRGDSDHASF